MREKERNLIVQRNKEGKERDEKQIKQEKKMVD